MANQSRRGFLAYLGLAGAATAITAVIIAPAVEVPESADRFKTPDEYLAAMQAIGWQPVAMFHPLPDGEVHRMGVDERPKPGVDVIATWKKFHAIQMRTPVQLPADVHPLGDWWKAVWQHLYDHGFRDDVTPPKAQAWLENEEDHHDPFPNGDAGRRRAAGSAFQNGGRSKRRRGDCDLLMILFDGEKAEACKEGIARLIFQIMKHEQASSRLHDTATLIVRRLAKP